MCSNINAPSTPSQLIDDLITLSSLIDISRGYLAQADISDESTNLEHMLKLMDNELDRIINSPVIHI